MLFGESSNQDKQYYKYNGKELDQMHGLNQYDYAARYYDPGYGRFTSVDPLAEKYYSISPYVYVANNPMKYIDPTGMFLYDLIGMSDKTKYGIVVVLPSGITADRAMKSDYDAAIAEGIPVMKVDDIKDFANGMKEMQERGISVDSYSVN